MRITVFVLLIVACTSMAGDLSKVFEVEQLERLVAAQWAPIESRYPFDPAERGSVAWSLAFSPPLPRTWPPAQPGWVTYYGYPRGRSPMSLADGEYVGAPWVMIEVSGDEVPKPVVLREDIESLGVQGVAPVEQAERGSARATRRGAAALTGLDRLLAPDDARAADLRTGYCFWASKNGVIAAQLARRHVEFFRWLDCAAL